MNVLTKTTIVLCCAALSINQASLPITPTSI